MKLISWVVPAYNPEPQWLSQCLESILNQVESPPMEVIVVDDGSDKPVRIAQQSKLIKLVRIDHKGVAGTLNEGLFHAQGDVIARLDADDINYCIRTKHQLRKLAEGYDLVGSAMNMVTSPGSVQAVCPVLDWTDQVAMLKTGRTLAWHPTWMFRRMAILQYPVDYPAAEDYAALCLLTVNGGKVGNVREALVQYRRHPKQVGKTQVKLQHESTIRAMQLLEPKVLEVVTIPKDPWVAIPEVEEKAKPKKGKK